MIYEKTQFDTVHSGLSIQEFGVNMVVLELWAQLFESNNVVS